MLLFALGWDVYIFGMPVAKVIMSDHYLPFTFIGLDYMGMRHYLRQLLIRQRRPLQEAIWTTIGGRVLNSTLRLLLECKRFTEPGTLESATRSDKRSVGVGDSQ